MTAKSASKEGVLVPSVCLLPDCKNIATSRGLCARHYSWLSKKVKEGVYTWGELESKGLVLSGKKGADTESEMLKYISSKLGKKAHQILG